MLRIVLPFLFIVLGLVLAPLLLVGLMFFGGFGLIEGLMLTGKPLAQAALTVLPAAFWERLSGVPGAASNPTVLSFLQLCVALGQVALLLAFGFTRLSLRR